MKRTFLFLICIGLGIYLILPRAQPFHPKHLYREINGVTQFSYPLSQRYYLIGKGAQFFAFESEDHKTVLKLFKARHYLPKLSRSFKHLLFSSSRADSEQRWRQKFQTTCACYEMAFEDLKNETGLLALHLKKTETPLTVQLIAGKKNYSIDLSELPFVIQKKAILLPAYLQHFIAHKEPEKAKRALQEMQTFFERRTQKGYTDERQSLRINYGFAEGQPIQIDPGKIYRLQTDPKEEIIKLHERLERWVLKYYPEIKNN